MQNWLKNIDEKKSRLGKLQPLPKALVKNLEDWFRIELTYTSNAIEGNTLTRSETALVVEKGITVSGRTLTEHLEAINYAEALDFIKELAGKRREKISEKDLMHLHWLILRKIDDANAGRYRNVQVRIVGTTYLPPSAGKVPDLMEAFFRWLKGKHPEHPVKLAADAHLRLVSIHPYVDGNGRTARLLMNLLLTQAGYPPALIRKRDRKSYIDSEIKAQTQDDAEDYYQVIYRAVDRSLNIYLESADPKSSKSRGKLSQRKKLLKIGELAKMAGETIPTIRFWTNEGLLEVGEYTEGGYQLYDPGMIVRAKKIREMQDKHRLSIAEIKIKLKNKTNDSSLAFD